jgi:Mn-containing catalase
MYHHVKKLMYTVKVDTPNVRFGNMLLEQFGGANGELAAAMQYTIQGWNCVDDLARRDLLLDIGTEELSHLEVVGALIRLHLKDLKTNREAAEADPLVTIAGGGGVNLYNSQGNAWTADYLKITGELDVDLRSNIAAEARAKIVYERLLDHTDDPGTIVPHDTGDHSHEGVFRSTRKYGKASLFDWFPEADTGHRRRVLQRLDR